MSVVTRILEAEIIR